MSVGAQSREQAVADAVREIGHIATLPEITLKIVKLVEDPNASAKDLNNVIVNDPALCSRILKVVNSAFYGLPGQIGSINRAIVLLGLNAVKNISIAASMAKLFKGGALTPTFSAKHVWEHSIGVATASKMVADAMKAGLADEAFLAGLIHDIGVVVEMQYERNKLIEAVTRAEAGENMLAAEDAVFGANHQDFGHGLCERWKFPASFATVTGWHHRPLELPADRRTLACIVYVADRLAGGLDGGLRLDLETTDIPDDVLAELKVGREIVEAIRAKLPEHLETVRQLLV